MSGGREGATGAVLALPAAVRAARYAALDALYAELAGSGVVASCKGLCWDSCTRIDMSSTEQARVLDVAGVELPRGNHVVGVARCPALTMFNRCGVYDVRPLICRLFGLVDGVECSHGCVSPRDLLPASVGYALIGRVYQIDGQDQRAQRAMRLAARPDVAAQLGTLARAYVTDGVGSAGAHEAAAGLMRLVDEDRAAQPRGAGRAKKTRGHRGT